MAIVIYCLSQFLPVSKIIVKNQAIQQIYNFQLKNAALKEKIGILVQQNYQPMSRIC
jgi:hypothetical protein